MLLELLGPEVFTGNLHLFLLGVAGQVDDFHAVAQGGLDGIERVGRGNEQNLAQVVFYFQVVIGEGGVLLRVQHFEQGRAGVAAEVAAHFINLVENDDGVRHAHLFNLGNNAAGHGPHVGFTVPANFGFVAHAPQAHADVLAPHGRRNAAPKRGFAHARRPVKAQNRRFQVLLQLEHGNVFEDALLHLFKAEMVGIEDFLGLFEVKFILGELAPGQVQQEFNVVQEH